ncbi:hypothetical protein L2E82_32848 [Cichorium intybus]|uniref:Uncharacterized protein n=1 Tax=Cichorium intybus TaxID=13427 RepID=A0ACB9BH10_CICIN|nr:hypothetical protein L2E82_32848 [Cichorium intybus]
MYFPIPLFPTPHLLSQPVLKGRLTKEIKDIASEIRSQSYLAVNVRQHRLGETDESTIYRINDDLEYLVEIYEWSGSNWEPNVANDVQGLYLASFKVANVYGVFQFKVEYQRLG